MSYINAENKYFNALSKHKMLKGHKSVLVAFSGGSDSSLLLELLSKTDGIKVGAAHLNHSIRGEEALRDQSFCQSFCNERNIPFYTKTVDIPLLAKQSGKSTEECARDERYKFLLQTAECNGYDLIATAHNADDNYETILFRLIRGTSPDGLCGIEPIRDNIIRPIIYLSKVEVTEACADACIPYVTDSTNADTSYTRNYIRHEILPKIKALNPSYISVLDSFVSSLKNDRIHLNKEASLHSFKDGKSNLKFIDDAILSRVVVDEFINNNITFDYSHIEAAINAIRSDNAHVSVSLKNACLVCDRNSIYIDHESKTDSECRIIPLKYGKNIIGDSCIIYITDNRKEFQKDINTLKNIYKLSIHTYADSAKINDKCYFRKRIDGDKYIYGGIRRKVKKLLQSLKQPLKYITTLPFIVNDEEILYIPHFPVSDSAKYKNDNNKVSIYYFSNNKYYTEVSK